MIKRYLNAALRSVTALLLSAVMAFGSAQYFAVNASAEEADMFCKVVYTTKYTYLTITPSDPDHKMYYTIDGSLPDMSSKPYKARLRASGKVTVRIVEYNEMGEAVDRKKITLKRKCLRPEVETRETEEGIEVTLTTGTEDAVIYYTTNGKKPTTSSKVYEGPFVVEDGATIRAFAKKTDWLNSSYLRETAVLEDSVTVETASDGSIMSEAAKITSSSVILKVLEETNKYRVENGLSELKLDATLCKAAKIRSDELYATDYAIIHTRPDGRHWGTVLDEVKYNYSHGGENIGYTIGDLNTANTIFQLWIDSSSHRANILDSVSEEIGIAYTKNGDKVYWVQIFGKER